MRRAFLLAAAIIALTESASVAQADSWYAAKPYPYVVYSGRYSCPYGYPTHGTAGGWGSNGPITNGTYGWKVRGGYGRNGYAPVKGPVWGTAAFAPPYETGNVPRPYGSYVRPLYPTAEVFEGEHVVPQEDVAPPAKVVDPPQPMPPAAN